MPAPRPPQPTTPAADAFTIHRADVDNGLQLAYIREGIGGYPLLLVHGYPESKRIWWRNIQPLVDAGYEVIVPDLRGYGDSDLSDEDNYDIVYYSKDLYALVHDVLGHERCGLVAGDVGGTVICDMANRYPGFVDKMVFFNTIPPMVIEQEAWYAERSMSIDAMEPGPTAEYQVRQGRDWRELILYGPDDEIVPIDRVELKDNWDVMGLRGTGSYDFDIPEQFVEDGRCFKIMSETVIAGGPIYSLGAIVPGTISSTAWAIGVAARALHEITELAISRVRLGSLPLAEQVTCQRDLGIGSGHQVFDERNYNELVKQSLGQEPSPF